MRFLTWAASSLMGFIPVSFLFLLIIALGHHIAITLMPVRLSTLVV